MEASEAFRKFCYEKMYEAREKVGNEGKLYVGISGGRKTMSSDLSDAAYVFGSDALIHIIDNGNINKEIKFTDNPTEYVKPFIPIITSSYVQQDFFDEINPQDVYTSVRELQEKAINQLTNYDTTDTNFKFLFQYRKRLIEKLKTTIIGVYPKDEEAELRLLQGLPKCDLHCHLGGALYPEDLIELVQTFSIPSIEKDADKKSVIELLKNAESAEQLEKTIFSSFIEEENFLKIGISEYEKLGDIQGSKLLQSKEIITFAVRKLIEHSISENILHLEIRCSPMNYTKGGLSGKEVLRTILETIDKFENDISVSVLIIASRHGDMSRIYQHIELMNEMKDDALFKKYFKGFDLAGNETIRRPEELRNAFMPVMKACYNITIHAGETEPVDNIWEAVYQLNAERIGHGLKLNENKDLQVKFLDRKIGIEMCPSSNAQIVGFNDNYLEKSKEFEKYPLKDYLDMGLLVSCNTDNRGISRTSATKELHRAARLTEGGLSLWDILKLIRNGYKTAFVSYKEKKELLLKAEEKIAKWLEENFI